MRNMESQLAKMSQMLRS